MHVTDQTHVGRKLRQNGKPYFSRNTLTHKVLFAWFYMAKSTQRLINQSPSELYLLSLLMLSNIAFFLSWTMKAVIVPNSAGISLVSTGIGALFLLSMVVRTCAMYVFAMVPAAVCHFFGGTGSFENTRLAVFWGAFVTAPFGIAAAVLSVIFTNLSLYFPIFKASWISMPPYWIGTLPFVWFISVAVARTQGFSRTSPLFLSMSVVALVGLMAAMYFHARGMI